MTTHFSSRVGKDAEVQAPPFGVLGDLPSDASLARVDLEPSEFECAVELHGKRLAWTRALRCPCAPVNSQSEQPDPNCRLCRGLSWTYFGDSRVQRLDDQSLTPAQLHVLREDNAFLIRGIFTGFQHQNKPWDNMGSWRLGMASVTTRFGNRIGFMDRLVNLDDRIIFTEVAQAPESRAGVLLLRYAVAGGVYMLRTADRILRAGQDFAVRQGRVHLLAPLAPKTRLAAHYVTFPSFLVQDLPNVSRETSLEDGVDGPRTGIGQSLQLPVRATLRLEFLPQPEVGE